MKYSGRVLAILLAALLGVLVGAGLAWLGYQQFIRPAAGRPSAAGPPPARGTAAPAPLVSRESQDAITAAIAEVGSAVVNINTLIRPATPDPRERLLREFMGIPTEPFPRPGQGSGIIIDGERGYVMTNAHVVKRAARLEVSLADGRRLDAEITGIDPLSDIAVVKVPGGHLPTATLGSAADLPIGSWVIAIGNPFGYENSVTVGVLSAKDRQVKGQDGAVLQDLLQTDAAINPGNSGGALVNLNGRVVGVPTAIIPYAQGMGFAVSVDVAKQVAERLIATGKMPWLGITHRDLHPEEIRNLGVPEGKGSLIVRVARRGPAAQAGILPGDVITNVGDQPIADAKTLGSAVRSHNAGERVRVALWREGRERALSVTLGEVPTEGFR